MLLYTDKIKDIGKITSSINNKKNCRESIAIIPQNLETKYVVCNSLWLLKQSLYILSDCFYNGFTYHWFSPCFSQETQFQPLQVTWLSSYAWRRMLCVKRCLHSYSAQLWNIWRWSVSWQCQHDHTLLPYAEEYHHTKMAREQCLGAQIFNTSIGLEMDWIHAIPSMLSEVFVSKVWSLLLPNTLICNITVFVHVWHPLPSHLPLQSTCDICH